MKSVKPGEQVKHGAASEQGVERFVPCMSNERYSENNQIKEKAFDLLGQMSTPDEHAHQQGRDDRLFVLLIGLFEHAVDRLDEVKG